MESKGFVQITAEEYDALMNDRRVLHELLSSDKCIEVSNMYSYDTVRNVIIYNPDVNTRQLLNELKEESQKAVQKYIDWLNKDRSKKIRFWHIGKTVQQVIESK